MQREGILADAVTYTCILKACATIGAADKGKQIHDEITRQELLQNDSVLGNALVDMYAKCGIVSKAQHCARQCSSGHVCQVRYYVKGTISARWASQNVVSWNELIRWICTRSCPAST